MVHTMDIWSIFRFPAKRFAGARMDAYFRLANCLKNAQRVLGSPV
jgi:hypothetical protein